MGQDSTFPVIINRSLSDVEEEKLLRILREHSAFGRQPKFFFYFYFLFFFFYLIVFLPFCRNKETKEIFNGYTAAPQAKIFNKKKKKSGEHLFSFLILLFSFSSFIPLRTMWNLILGEGILFLIFQKKKIAYDKNMVEISYNFRNHSHCLSPVVNSLLDLV